MSMQRYAVDPKSAGQSLQDFLASKLNLSRNKAKAILDARHAFVNGRRVWMTKHELRKGDIVEVAAPAPSVRPASVTPSILYQDNEYLIVNKAAGTLSNGPDSLETTLQGLLNQPRLKAVHRLDRDTSGCILIARSNSAFDKAVELFKSKLISKVYHVLASGKIEDKERRVEYPIDGEPAVTHLYLISSNTDASHLRVKIDTGRTHQIRKHLAYIGHPVLGDRTYAGRTVIPEAFRMIGRQLLHAANLTFESPFSGQKIRAEAALPRDFTTWLRRLDLR